MSEAPEGITQDVLDPAAPPEGQSAPDAATEIEEAAGKGGWLPKDQWTGDPEKWVDAPKFVLKAAEILPQLTSDLKEARAEIKTVKKAVEDSAKFISAAEKRAYDRGVSEASARLDAAAAIGDVDGVRAATQEIVDLSKEVVGAPAAAALPELDTWRAANPWYGPDEALTAAVDAIGKKAFDEGYRGAAQVKEVAERVKAKFPHLYTNPNRAAAAAVEGAGGGPRKTAQSYSDMPAEAREMCVFFEKNTKGFSRDKYVKDYFKGQSA